MLTEYEKQSIDTIIKEFDFDHVHKTIVALDLKTFDSNTRTYILRDVDQLKSDAREFLTEFCQMYRDVNDRMAISQGYSGFTVLRVGFSSENPKHGFMVLFYGINSLIL
jgi:hypothetical protein